MVYRNEKAMEKEIHPSAAEACWLRIPRWGLGGGSPGAQEGWGRPALGARGPGRHRRAGGAAGRVQGPLRPSSSWERAGASI